LVLAVFLIAASSHATDWNADLDFLQRELPKTHPNAFHATSREAWEAAIARLRERAPSMRAADVAVEISRIVAMIGDGHTRLTLPVDPNAGFFTGHTPTPVPPDPALHFHHFPVRFYWHQEGLFVLAAAEQTIVGWRVLRIGDRTAEEAMAAAGEIVSADNAMGRRLAAADALAVPEVLQALSIAPRLTLEGTDVGLPLEPIKFGEAAPWLPKPDPRLFHFETRDGIVHFTYDEIGNEKDQTLAAFLARMMPVVEQSEALVIDLRSNPGGNGSFNRVLLHALIRSRKLRQPGRLFVLIGRRTFSAANDLCVRLEQNTNAVFVGEPTGGSPNGYGDSRKLTLPSSGLTVRVSTLYWQPSDPRDKRDAVAPDIAVPPARDRDAAMERVRGIVRALRAGKSVEGEWSGSLRLDFEIHPYSHRQRALRDPRCEVHLRAGRVRDHAGGRRQTLRRGGSRRPRLRLYGVTALNEPLFTVGRRLTGSLSTMLVPTPSIDATVTSPPCASTICRTM
jgi:hypothetical protein